MQLAVRAKVLTVRLFTIVRVLWCESRRSSMIPDIARSRLCEGFITFRPIGNSYSSPIYASLNNAFLVSAHRRTCQLLSRASSSCTRLGDMFRVVWLYGSGRAPLSQSLHQGIIFPYQPSGSYCIGHLNQHCLIPG